MPIQLKTTKSICPICLRVIAAETYESEGKIYIKKQCSEHGHFQALHPWSNPKHYQAALSMHMEKTKPPAPEGLVINVNSVCNQNCPFCFARANEHIIPEPTIEQIIQSVSKFKGRVIYLSGGEPALRKDTFEIIKQIKYLGFQVFLFSNGKKLSDEGFVRNLKISGLDFVILQFDTFDDCQSKVLRNEALSSFKMKAIENLKKYHIHVYLFVMLVKNINVNQISKILELALNSKGHIRIVNFNPVWNMGRYLKHELMDASAILIEVVKRQGLSCEDFFDTSILSCHISSIQGKFSKIRLNKYPKCEFRCYFMVGSNKNMTPITRLVDVKKVNKYLQSINSCLSSCAYGRALMQAVCLSAYAFNRFCRSSRFRYAIAALLADLLKIKPMLYSNRMMSVIVGTFHTAFNIDLDFAETCNLYSDYPDKNKIFTSSCLRQITCMQEQKAKYNHGHSTHI